MPEALALRLAVLMAVTAHVTTPETVYTVDWVYVTASAATDAVKG